MQQFVAARVILHVVPSRPGHPEQQSPHARTQADAVRPGVWLVDDPVIQLREWATEKIHSISGLSEPVMGADPSADLVLVDPKRSVSRKHARLVREEGHWVIEDLESRNGIRCDGVRSPNRRFVIVPGMEIGLGSLTLVAENATLARLRGYLARVLGWNAKAHTAMDLAIRVIRAAGNRRVSLILAGSDDLVAVARQIHRRTMPADAPFVVCGQGLRESDANVRATATVADASVALERAAGGTICVRADKLPLKYDELVEAAADPRAAAQLFVCTANTSKRRDPITPPIVVPKLASRSEEDLQRIVSEYALDAIRELGAEPTAFTDDERAWVVKHETSTFADIEIATLRIIARNTFGSVYQAALHLGVSHVALGKWFKRRKLARSAGLRRTRSP